MHSALRVVIADDEPLALERLSGFFADIPGTEVVGTASNGEEAAGAVASLLPDLLILDIHMPKQNGLRVAAALPEADRPEIVFVSAFEHFAADAFVVEAADYILKPVRFDRLWQAVERAKRRQYLRRLEQEAADAQTFRVGSAAGTETEAGDGVWVHGRGSAVFVPISTIDWVEAQRDYVLLHTPTRSHMVRLSMRVLEDKLDPERVPRVHRSAFARLSNVVEVKLTGNTISGLVLRDGAIVPVGPNYAKNVARLLKSAVGFDAADLLGRSGQ